MKSAHASRHRSASPRQHLGGQREIRRGIVGRASISWFTACSCWPARMAVGQHEPGASVRPAIHAGLANVSPTEFAGAQDRPAPSSTHASPTTAPECASAPARSPRRPAPPAMQAATVSTASAAIGRYIRRSAPTSVAIGTRLEVGDSVTKTTRPETPAAAAAAAPTRQAAESSRTTPGTMTSPSPARAAARSRGRALAATPRATNTARSSAAG